MCFEVHTGCGMRISERGQITIPIATVTADSQCPASSGKPFPESLGLDRYGGVEIGWECRRIRIGSGSPYGLAVGQIEAVEVVVLDLAKRGGGDGPWAHYERGGEGVGARLGEAGMTG